MEFYTMQRLLRNQAKSSPLADAFWPAQALVMTYWQPENKPMK